MLKVDPHSARTIPVYIQSSKTCPVSIRATSLFLTDPPVRNQETTVIISNMFLLLTSLVLQNVTYLIRK